MSLTITKRPDRANKEDGTVISRWLSAHQPVIFEFQRSDYVVFSFSDNSGKVGILISNTEPNLSQWTVGDRVYIKSFPARFDTSGLVTIVTTLPLYTLIVTDIDWTGGTGFFTGFCNRNSRVNYYVEFKLNVLVKSIVSGSIVGEEIEIPVRCSTDNKGAGTLSCEGYLSGYLKKLHEDIHPINSLDSRASISFFLSFTEKYTDSIEDEVVDGGSTAIRYYAIDGGKYFLSSYGQNFADYLPSSVNLETKAKFLSVFKEPVLFAGYPFALSFIYPDELYTSNVTIQQERFGDTGNSLGTINDDIDVSQVGGVNFLVPLDLVGNEESIDVWLRIGSIAQRSVYVAGTYQTGTHVLIPPTVGSIEPFDITEKKRIRIVEPNCNGNKLYLRWRNAVGGWEHWLFDKRAVNEQQTKSGSIFEVNRDDMETSTGNEYVVSSSQNNRITMYDYVAADKFEGLKTIQGTSWCQLLINREDNVWIDVKVIAENVRNTLGAAMADFKVTIELPDNFNTPN